ncbi:dihydrolipoyl dehydrogenase [Pullulanibacillus sp. KACC 23026]|uniref:dihydrolipoyl dehydrogenase n=1 Tax=Pullulanibacillus sp. KACC 23026 TaxID=3028315 RepID=UPI0023AF4E99|nr:dihydrolipoyl dehydrogenase [Pullulanibacillus sp. KACC 23026]WEG10762.1 dihydrolipoyl dehydrogenase [Pullulanibacillus sp. KACC 23026]
MATIAIIGGGPAGYVAAITAAQQGHNVTLIDQRQLGGTCLNEGCMPTKSLLESVGVYSRLQHAGEFGIRLRSDQLEIDWNTVHERKNKIVSRLVQGIQYLMKKNKVKVIKGKAIFQTSCSLRIENNGLKDEITADKIIIAAGSEPIQLPFAPFDGDWIVHSGQVMSLQSIPSSLLIIGGGVIGCEFASIYCKLGTKVTIVEMAEQLLPGEDKDVADILHKQLENDGVSIYLSTRLIDLNKDQKKAIFESDKGLHEVQSDLVLISIGRKPKVTNLGLENIGMDVSKQGIQVNEQMQTNIPNIYACGDVIGGTQLAHVAFHEGKVAALNSCGMDTKVNYRAVPRCIYTSPEIASVGLTEKQAKDQYGDVRVGEFPFSANGKALIANEEIGKVKVLIEPEFGEIVGVSIVGPHATELIGQGSLMLHSELTTDSMEHYIAAHPSLSEAIYEALHSTIGNAVHV